MACRVGKGVSLEYQGFTIKERQADGSLDETVLRSILAEGTSPIGEGGTGAEERCTPVDAMPFEDMLGIAESLQPPG